MGHYDKQREDQAIREQQAIKWKTKIYDIIEEIRIETSRINEEISALKKLIFDASHN